MGPSFAHVIIIESVVRLNGPITPTPEIDCFCVMQTTRARRGASTDLRRWVIMHGLPRRFNARRLSVRPPELSS